MSDLDDIRKIVNDQFSWDEEISPAENVQRMIDDLEDSIDHYRYRPCNMCGY